MSFRILLYISFYDLSLSHTNTFCVALDGGGENDSSADSSLEFIFLDEGDDTSWFAALCSKETTEGHAFPSLLPSLKSKRLDSATMTHITMMRVHDGYS